MTINTYEGAKGMHLYARMCAVIAREPMTTAQVAQACDLSARHLGITLRGLRDRGVLHVKDWVRERTWCWWTEVWAFGPGTDAPRPLTNKGTPNTRAPKSEFRIETFMFGLVIKALEEGADVPTICELTGLNRTTAQALIRRMRQEKFIHVSSWFKPPTGGIVAIWKLGDKRNATKPKRRTDSERRAQDIVKNGARVPGAHLQQFLAAPLAH